MIYYGTVTRMDDVLVYVTIPDLGGSAEMGPYPALGWSYTRGERVAVSRLSAVMEDMIVLGPISTGQATPTGNGTVDGGSPSGDIDGGTPTAAYSGTLDGGNP